MTDCTIHIGILTVEFHIPCSTSLKNKRRVLKSLKDRIRVYFNASVAEVGEMDKWQRSVIGISVIGSDKSYLNGCLDQILSVFDNTSDIQILNHQLEFV